MYMCISYYTYHIYVNVYDISLRKKKMQIKNRGDGQHAANRTPKPKRIALPSVIN